MFHSDTSIIFTSFKPLMCGFFWIQNVYFAKTSYSSSCGGLTLLHILVDFYCCFWSYANYATHNMKCMVGIHQGLTVKVWVVKLKLKKSHTQNYKQEQIQNLLYGYTFRKIRLTLTLDKISSRFFEPYLRWRWRHGVMVTWVGTWSCHFY